MSARLTYCEIRRDLEDRTSTLTSMLFHECSRLLMLIGQDHQAFLQAKQECRDLRLRITVSHHALQAHLVLHEC